MISRDDETKPAVLDLVPASKCPLWVISRHMQRNRRCPLYPNSDRESGLPAKVMSALPPRADMCGARAHVCYGPIDHLSVGRYLVHPALPMLLAKYCGRSS